MAENNAHYTAFDHTDLERRRKKLWNIADGLPLTIIGGVDLRALVASSGVFLGLAAITAGLMFLPFVDLNAWVILGYFAVAVGVYWLWPRRWGNGLTSEQNLLVLVDYLVLQPRRIHGLAADVEPEQVHWRAILWDPVHPAWRRALAEARTGRPGLRREHPDDRLLSADADGVGVELLGGRSAVR